jgi:hypothetical protein
MALSAGIPASDGQHNGNFIDSDTRIPLSAHERTLALLT